MPAEVKPRGGSLAVVPRQGAVRRRLHELEFLPGALEIIETPASRVGRWMMGVLVLTVASAIVWACFGKVDIIASASGRLIPSGQVKLIQPLEIGVVKRVVIADGQHVRAGDSLVELDTTSTGADQEKVARDLMQARLDTSRLGALLVGDAALVRPPDADPDMLEAAQAQLLTELSQHRAKIDGLDRQIQAKTAEREQSLAIAAKLQATLPLLLQKQQVYHAVAENQFASRIAVLEAERALVEAQHDRIAVTFQIEQLGAEIAGLVQQREQARAELRAQDMKDLAKANQTAAGLQQDQVKARQRTGLQTLRAPVDGTVEQVSVHTVGGVVTPAQTLMIVVPDGSALEVEAMLPNRDVGFVHAGQPVEIKVEAFTFTRYGLLHGQVLGVSRDAMRGRGGDVSDKDPFASQPGPAGPAEAANGTSSYMVRASVDETKVETEEGMLPLTPGMAITAEIRTGNRRVIDYLLSPFMRYRHEGLRER